MRPRARVMAALLLAMTAAAAPARDPRAADRAAIVAGEQAWGQSFVTRDATTIERLLDDGFMGTDIDGSRYTKAQMLRWARDDPPNTANRTVVTAVRFWGDTAVVQGEDHVVGPSPAREPRLRIWTDSWIRRAGRWRIVGSHDMRPPTTR